MGTGRPELEKSFSTSSIDRSRGVPLMVMLFCEGCALSYAKAASAITRNRNGSAFCAKSAAACFVFAMMSLSHHSALFDADGANSV